MEDLKDLVTFMSCPVLGTPAKKSNKYKYTYTKKQLLEIGEPKPVVDWMNVVQKYEMLSISIVVRMQRLSNSPFVV